MHLSNALEAMYMKILDMRPQVNYKASQEWPEFVLMENILDEIENIILNKRMPLEWYSEMGIIIDDFYEELIFFKEDHRWLLMRINDATKLVKEAEKSASF